MTEIKQKIKMAIISGASHALQYKNQNPGLPDEEIIRKVSKESDSILGKIDAAK